jgi:hypothetical protein
VPHTLQTLIATLPILPLFKGGGSMEIITDTLMVPFFLLLLHKHLQEIQGHHCLVVLWSTKKQNLGDVERKMGWHAPLGSVH